MSELINHTLTIRFIPRRSWLALGPGWAALAAFLAAGTLQFDLDFWAINAVKFTQLALFWILADPLLGSLWHLVVEEGVWRRLKHEARSTSLPVKPVLPYTARHTAGHRLSAMVAALKAQNDSQWQTVLLLAGLTLVLAALLGKIALLYVTLSIALALFIGKQPLTVDEPWRRFWASIALFLLPYLTGLLLFQSTERNALLLGLCYWIAHLGSLRLLAHRPLGDRLTIFGQIVASVFLFAITKPIAATVVALSAIFTIWFRLSVTEAGNDFEPQRLALEIRPLLLVGLLVAAATLGGMG